MSESSMNETLSLNGESLVNLAVTTNQDAKQDATQNIHKKTPQDTPEDAVCSLVNTAKGIKVRCMGETFFKINSESAAWNYLELFNRNLSQMFFYMRVPDNISSYKKDIEVTYEDGVFTIELPYNKHDVNPYILKSTDEKIVCSLVNTANGIKVISTRTLFWRIVKARQQSFLDLYDDVQLFLQLRIPDNITTFREDVKTTYVGGVFTIELPYTTEPV